MQSRNSSNIKGVDISNWQTGINYGLLSKSKSVAIIKATEGVSFIDSMLETHYNGCKTAGMKIGFYHYFSDKTNPTQQARDFWNAIKNKQMDILPVLDVESSTRSKKEVTDRCLEFLNEMKRLSGYICIVYTYTSFAIEKLDTRLASYPLWIAHYGVNTPGNNGIWNTWVGFQYTEKEQVQGVPNPCDSNEFNSGIFINKINASEPHCVIKADVLNVREGNSTTNKIIGTLTTGETVKVKSIVDDWVNIDFRGNNGYVSKKYVDLYNTEKIIQKKSNFPTKNYTMDYIIVYSNAVDRVYADRIANALCCPTIHGDIPFYYNNIKNVICVGAPGKMKFTGYCTKLIQGKNREETEKLVNNYINSL